MKSRVLAFIFLVLFPICIYGQKQSSKISLGINGTPMMLYRTVQIDENYSSYPTYDQITKNEIPIFGYNLGLQIVWQKFEKVNFESGLFYSQRGFGWKDEIVLYHTGSQDPVFEYEFIGKIIHNYFDIPLTICYNLFEGNLLQVYLRGGPNFNILVNSYGTTASYDGESAETYKTFYNFEYLNEHGFHRLNISIIAATGIKVSINDNLKSFFEPLFNYTINPYHEISEVSRNYCELGIRIGFLRKF